MVWKIKLFYNVSLQIQESYISQLRINIKSRIGIILGKVSLILNYK
ncbi:hypothetical protein pb186bvf_011413 [Paramecium bursaria]